MKRREVLNNSEMQTRSAVHEARRNMLVATGVVVGEEALSVVVALRLHDENLFNLIQFGSFLTLFWGVTKWDEYRNIKEGVKEAKKTANNVGRLVEQFCEGKQYDGESPYIIDVMDREESTAYRIELRNGTERQDKRETPWITIIQRSISNPGFLENYLLEKRGDEWRYEDPYLSKYGENNIPRLKVVEKRLQKVWDSLHPLE